MQIYNYPQRNLYITTDAEKNSAFIKTFYIWQDLKSYNG